MKLILKIAGAEIRNLFYSPVAWFLSAAFLIQCAYYYTTSLAGQVKFSSAILENNPDYLFTNSLTQSIFLNSNGIFHSVMTNLYLFIPLLTMGAISREINNGTIKLLYSSPVKIYEIVMGKFIALMIYNILLLLILSIFLVSGLFSIRNVDFGYLFSALLGFYLLVCAYSAIGIFMSSLTTYQIVSAVSTFLAIFVLSNIGGLWQEYDFTRDLTYFLSINGRTERMMQGLITTNDVFYFLLIIWMFISFTILRLKATIEFKRFAVRFLRYLAVIIIVLGLGYASSLPRYIGYWDTTRNNNNTIHESTQKIIKDFKKGKPLVVTLYANLLSQEYLRGAPASRNDYRWNLWDKYLRFLPDIRFKYVYYYDDPIGDSTIYHTFPNKTTKEIAEILATKYYGRDLSFFKSPEEIRKIVDLKPENNRLVMQLQYNGRSTFLRTFPDYDFWPDEKNVSAAFKRLQVADLPKVLFTTGNLERSIYKTGEREHNTYSAMLTNRISLVNIGFNVDTINLDQAKIPGDADVLVVADPKSALSAVKTQQIRNYLNKGKNAFFMGEPGKQQMLNPVLSQVGAKLDSGILVEVTKNEMPQMIKPLLTREALALSDRFYVDRKLLNSGKKIIDLPFVMPGACAISKFGDSVAYQWMPIFRTDPSRNAFNRVQKLVVDSVPPVFDPHIGDTRQNQYVTLAGLSKAFSGYEQHVAISGDADLFSNLRAGGTLITEAIFSWLDDNRFPNYAPKDLPTDVYFSISLQNAVYQYYFFVWILPLLLVLFATIFLIRRKRK